MWNPTIYIFIYLFFDVLCVSWRHIQNLSFFLEPVMSLELRTVYSSSFPSHSRRASAMFVLRGFYGSGRPKTPHNWKLHNIKLKKCSDATDNNLGDLASIVFFVMQCILVHVGTAEMAVWAGQLRKLSFICRYSTNWGIHCFNWLQWPSTLIRHPHEKWWTFPLNCWTSTDMLQILYKLSVGKLSK